MTSTLEHTVRTAEIIVTGMTKTELIATICIVVIAVCALMIALSYILKLHLKPLADVPSQLAEIRAKVKSGDDLDRMIAVKVQHHELYCPARNNQKACK